MIPQTPLYRTGCKIEKIVKSLFLRVPIRHSIVPCLALLTVCALLLLTTVNVLASTVTINDQAGVLDAGRVQADAAQLPDPIFIYTTKTFTGDQDALNQSTREQLPNQDSIAIGIDTVHRNLSIEAGTNVQLSNSQASDAVSAFQSNIDNGGDYTSATITALDSVQNASNSQDNSQDPWSGTPAYMLVSCWIFLFIIGIVVAVLYVVSRKGGGSDGRPRGSFWGGSYHGGDSGGGGGGGHF